VLSLLFSFPIICFTNVNFLISRKRLRAAATCSPLWARSPSPPRKLRKLQSKKEETSEKGDDSAEDKKKDSRKKCKYDSDESSSDSSSSDDESSTESSSSSSDSESDSKRKKRKRSGKSKKHRHRDKKKGHKEKKKKKAKTGKDEKAAVVLPTEEEDDDALWVEKKTAAPAFVGPVPLPQVSAPGYGGAMLPGEAEAYAKYVKENTRIPRRGEVGLTSEEIEKFESLGYVMSGSRYVVFSLCL
jgi:hypothetical protein